MTPWWMTLWIGLGSALGGMGRFWVSGWVASRIGETFPWGTFVANVTGCILVGFLAALTVPEGRLWMPPRWSQFLILGLCGGYTTFSSFSLQTLHLVRDGEWLYAAGNVALSLVACLVGVWLGYLLGELINR